MSATERRVFGVGCKDPLTKVYTVSAGKITWRCPYYTLWTSILRRCYSDVFLRNNPSYAGCVVAKEWHTFETFRDWVRGNPNKMGFLCGALQLDKDILGSTREYSVETCVFVPRYINSLFNDRQGEGVLPLGVHFNTECGKYKAQISNRGSREFLGYFKDSLTAHKAWQGRKVEILMLTRKQYLLEPYADCRVAKAIKETAREILRDLSESLVTHKTLRHQWQD